MTTDTKVIISSIIVTGVVLVGAVFIFSKDITSSIPKDQIVTQNGLHWHPKLSIYIKGEKQEIPPNVGIGTVHQKIHTHEDATDGILHMEMQGIVTKEDTKIGNFFRIWGKEFSLTKIFDKTNGSGGVVRMTVNGRENKDFENYQMRDGDKIEIVYE